MKQIKNILCYSQYDFDCIMENNEWYDSPSDDIAVISISSANERNLDEHWFKDDCHGNIKNVFNLNIDDITPYWFENHVNECYDLSLELYLNHHIKESNAYFNHLDISGKNKEFLDMYHCLDYEEAFDLVRWIDEMIGDHKTIYVHCAAGRSRSQGVVRYIIDTYGDMYHINTNPDNPNITFNPHVVMMLKRAFRNL